MDGCLGCLLDERRAHEADVWIHQDPPHEHQAPKGPGAQAVPYQRLPQLLPQPPRHPPPPRTSLMMSNSISAPMVALMIAAIMPEPRWMPS